VIRLDNNLGLIGPAAWVLSTMLGQMMPDRDCTQGSHRLLVGMTFCFLVAVLGTALSMRARQATTETDRFLVRLGGVTNLAFTLTILMQGLAIAVIDPCLR
jgi:hypothetical protein